MSFDLALINGDLSLKSDGTVRTVQNIDKLKQDIIKIVLTPIGSIRFHPWYGSAINDNLIGQNIPDNALFHDLSSAVLDSLNRLQKLQRAQSTYQRVSLSELIATIRDVLVQRNPSDPRQVNVMIYVISKDFNAVDEVFTINS